MKIHRLPSLMITTLVLSVCVVTAVASAAKRAVDPPLKVITYTTDNQRLAGYLTGYDTSGFDLKDAKGETSEVAWTKIQPRNVYLLHQRAFGKDATADDWLALGRLLLTMGGDDATPFAERAFREGLKKDDSVASRIAQIKANTTPAASPDAGADGDAAPATTDDEPTDESALSVLLPGVNNRGASLTVAWPELTEAQSNAAIEEAKQFAERTRTRINDKLRLYETKYFLFYTDLDDPEARKWQGLMDKMYARLIDMFALERGRNIWKGKALIFVFKRQADYQRFQVEMHRTNPGTSAGMCHSFSNGDVHIAFFRDEDEMRFAHVMVHETVHGFVHRYRSPVPVISWVNEGLAEWLSMELLPNYRSRKAIRQETANILRETGGSLRGMLSAQHIQPWQYGVTTALTDVMIEYKRTAYVEFIKSIKAGKAWGEAFEETFGMPIDKFLVGFGRSLKLDAVTP